MSMFDDVAQVFVDCAGIMTAVDRLMELLAQFNALAPDWSEAPEWAQWCVIHANGLQYWFPESEPVALPGTVGWLSRDARSDFYRELKLPLGIDWRLCKWQRPEVQR